MTATFRPAMRLESASFSYRTVAIGSSCLAGADGAQSGRGALELRERHSPRPLELDDAVRAQQLLEVVDLRGMPVEGHGDLVVADAEHASVEDLDELQDLAADVGRRLDRAQQQLTLDRVVGMQLADLHDVDELEQLLGDLLDRRRLGVDDDRDAAEALVVG